jgi:hypothetical protein
MKRADHHVLQCGAIREDGMVFVKYLKDKEYWVTPEKFDRVLQARRADESRRSAKRRSTKRLRHVDSFKAKAIRHHYAKGRDVDWITLWLGVPQSSVVAVIEKIKLEEKCAQVGA